MLLTEFKVYFYEAYMCCNLLPIIPKHYVIRLTYIQYKEINEDTVHMIGIYFIGMGPKESAD